MKLPLSVFLASQTPVDIAPIERSIPVEVQALQLEADHADLTIRSDPGATRSQVTIRPTRWPQGCSIEFGGTHELAEVDMLFDGEPAGRTCAAEIEITIASATRLDADIGRGDIHLDKPVFPMSLVLGSGEVSGTPGANGAQIDVRRGRVELTELTRAVDVYVGIGTIELEYDSAISGTVEAHVGLGRIRAFFPYGIFLDRDVDTRLGRAVLELPHANDAMTRVEASAGVGVVQLKPILTPRLASMSPPGDRDEE